MAPSKKFLQPINLLNSDTDPVLADIGDIYYNTVLETIRLYDGAQWASILDGAIQVGQELYYSVSNNTGAIIPKGTVVYANGPDGEYVSIAPAIADGSIDPELFLGITTSDIQIGGQGYVAYFGKVSGVSGSLANGTTIYVSATTVGGFQEIAPEAPNVKLPVGFISNQNGLVMDIMVRMGSAGVLNSLDDVQTSLPQEGDILSYSAVRGRWENTAPIPADNAGLVASGANYPLVGVQDGQLFYNTTSGRTAIFFDTAWKEFIYVSDINLDGGEADTTEFRFGLDGGLPSTTVFIGVYNGGAPNSFML